ncbi:hypothetical protein [Pyrodictium abyssi]|uniref:Uncharacterized protein n=1 Tax=Pyrodictium abyssi TaxID=54256 RepID=A0ABM8IVA1_9CREN|nr:hypothetical protein PABY_10570 [Pyrodictium abyssi]
MSWDWLLPVAYLAYTRSRLDQSELARLLGVPGSMAKKLLWAAIRHGFVRMDNGFIDITMKGARLVEKVWYVARASNRFVFVMPGRLVIVFVRPRRGLRAYSITARLACNVYAALASGVSTPREISSRIGVHPKTVSLAIRALRVLGCPGACCVLVGLCSGLSGKE